MKKIKALLLAAGKGTRLRPYSDNWPKCLMPISGHPLLSYWLQVLSDLGVVNILINTSYLAEIVEEFLERPVIKNKITVTREIELLGTAGTLRKNYKFFNNTSAILLIHADNFCHCDFTEFINYHINSRPKKTLITMMTFESNRPETCGIVELDKDGVVIKFHEKKPNPPSKRANAAIYILEPEVLDWICNNPCAYDFSLDVIPYFLGKIATWNNNNVNIDIGSISALKEAQKLSINMSKSIMKNELFDEDEWLTKFRKSEIFNVFK